MMSQSSTMNVGQEEEEQVDSSYEEENSFKGSRLPRKPRVLKYQTPNKPKSKITKERDLENIATQPKTFEIKKHFLEKEDELVEQQNSSLPISNPLMEEGQILEEGDAGASPPPVFETETNETSNLDESVEHASKQPTTSKPSSKQSTPTFYQNKGSSTSFTIRPAPKTASNRSSIGSSPKSGSELTSSTSSFQVTNMLGARKSFLENMYFAIRFNIGIFFSYFVLFELNLLSRDSKWRSLIVSTLIVLFTSIILFGLSGEPSRIHYEENLSQYTDDINQKLIEILQKGTSTENLEQLLLKIIEFEKLTASRLDQLQESIQTLSKNKGSQSELSSLMNSYSQFETQLKETQKNLNSLKSQLESIPSNEQSIREAVSQMMNNQILEKVLESLLPQIVQITESYKSEFFKQVSISNETIRALIKETLESPDDEIKQWIGKAIQNVQPESSQLGVPEHILNQIIKKLISEQLKPDTVGKPDYALASAGAKIVRTRTSPTYRKPKFSMFPLNYLLSDYGNPPNVILHPDNTVGNCWAFPGTTGHVAIKLSHPIIPESFSLDHIDPSIAFQFESCPKVFGVWGLQNETDSHPKKLGQYEYKKNEGTVQTFEVQDKQNLDVYPIILLDILSNYGNKEYTCIYRFRVHGKPNKT